MTKPKLDKRPIAIDLFSGAGGMSIGFELAGFKVAAAVEADHLHALTYRYNFPDTEVVEMSVSDLTGRELRKRAGIGNKSIDVLFGGPPCQGFSMRGRRDQNDKRNDLLLEFARLVRELRPKYFVLENVEGLLLGDSKLVLKSFVRRAKLAGYSIVEPIQVLDASHYGVPQRRRRVIVLGYRKGQQAPEYPKPTTNGDCPRVFDAIGDLPNISKLPKLLESDIYTGGLGKPSEYADALRRLVRDSNGKWRLSKRRNRQLSGCLRTEHSAKITERFVKTKQGEEEQISQLRRLKAKGLSPTIRAGTDQTRGSYTAPRPIHPKFHRCITVREAARLQSFPDSHVFHETVWHGCRQVGNAVPPLLARAIAGSIAKLLSKGK